MKATRLVLACLGLYFYFTGLLLAAQNTTPTAGNLRLPARTAATTSSAAPAPSAPAGSGPASSAPPSGGAPSPAASNTGSVGPVRNVLLGEPVHSGFVTAIGARSGQLGGGVIEAVKFQFHPDTSSTGVTSLGAITFTKKWDGASIPLLSALSNKEVLTSVSIDFLAIDRTGKEATVMTVKLTNATVMSVNQYLDSTGAMEDVTVGYMAIDITDQITKKTFSWTRAK